MDQAQRLLVQLDEAQLQQLGLRQLEPEDPNVIVRPQLRDRALHATGSPGAATLADAEKATMLRRSKYQAQLQHSGILREYERHVRHVRQVYKDHIYELHLRIGEWRGFVHRNGSSADMVHGLIELVESFCSHSPE